MARNTHVPADTSAPAVTAILANLASAHPSRGWSDAVEHEAHRTFYNWLGCAIGAARHEAADAALSAIQMLEPAAQATVLGRREKVDMANAALLNGITSHTFDFDDTHLKTIIHPAGPVASAVLALAEQRGASGRDVIDALVLGIDVACRVGNAMYPEHYDRGWHITGSTGMLGAAAGCARVLRLDAQQTAMALGIAASQPVGFREQFGTMTKPFHPGGAARAGLVSALLASRGFTASPRALEAPRGFMQVASDKRDWNEITDALGQRFEISFNTYKPFACGIVIHPSIDASFEPGRIAQAGDAAVELIDLAAHLLQKSAAQQGQVHGARCAVEQPHAQYVLQVRNAARQRRLRQVQGLGGRSEALQIAHGDEGAQIGQRWFQHGETQLFMQNMQ